jgi:adenylate kinase family enzyme
MAPQRIVIVGCSGSGKSTLARKLGRRLGLPVVHLDVLHYLPGWKRASLAEFRARVTEAHQGEAWISEGNFASWTFDIRLPRTEAFIMLERPRWLCLWRVIRRAAIERRNRPDLPLGCPEQVDRDLLEYVWNSVISERSDGPRSRRRGSTTVPRFRCSGSVVIAKSPNFWRRRSSRWRKP